VAAPVTGRLEQLRITARLRRVLAERARYDAGGDAERAAWREERLHELRRHAVSRAPLYGRLHHDLETAPLRTLPSIGKADVVDRFDELVTDRRLSGAVLSEVVGGGGGAGGRALGRYRIGATSGSSGRPGLFPFDEVEWTALIANAARARGLAGRPQVDGRVRTAKVGSPSPWHLSRQVAATLQDPRKPSLASTPPATSPAWWLRSTAGSPTC
jgi:phenylacetate-coenzyme A ligase PaaK-like adenylate-forming protein